MSKQPTTKKVDANMKKLDGRRVRRIATWQHICKIDDEGLKSVFAVCDDLALMKVCTAWNAQLKYLSLLETTSPSDDAAFFSSEAGLKATLEAYRLAPRAFQEHLRPWYVQHVNQRPVFTQTLGSPGQSGKVSPCS